MDTHSPTLTFEFLAGIGPGTPVKTTIRARWSLVPERKLLLFVHGFNGHGTGTWADLPGQLCLHSRVSGYDLIFFQYDSLRLNADESADLLHGFLDDLLVRKSPALVNASLTEYDSKLRRPVDWKYDSVVFVAHSLGACVVRQTLLNHISTQGSVPWPEDTKLIWFAPAHGGARILRLLTLASLGVPVDFFTAATFFAPVLSDLKERSDFLATLRSETSRLGASHPALGAPLTFWAYNDKVVLNRSFPLDRKPYCTVNGASHISICKPTGYTGVVHRLLQEL